MAQGGIVARYKEPYRDFLYREMFARWGQMDVLARGSGTTVFSIDRVPGFFGRSPRTRRCF